MNKEMDGLLLINEILKFIKTFHFQVDFSCITTRANSIDEIRREISKILYLFSFQYFETEFTINSRLDHLDVWIVYYYSMTLYFYQIRSREFYENRKDSNTTLTKIDLKISSGNTKLMQMGTDNTQPLSHDDTTISVCYLGDIVTKTAVSIKPEMHISPSAESAGRTPPRKF